MRGVPLITILTSVFVLPLILPIQFQPSRWSRPGCRLLGLHGRGDPRRPFIEGGTGGAVAGTVLLAGNQPDHRTAGDRTVIPAIVNTPVGLFKDTRW